MRRAALVCLLLLATACTHDSKPTAPVAVRTSTPPPPPPGLVVAVPLASQGIGLYRIGRDHHSTLVRTLSAPGGADGVRQLALSGSADPDLCAAWVGRKADGGDLDLGLWCYRPGDLVGLKVPAVAEPQDLALSSDSSRIAWLSDTYRDNTRVAQRISIAAYKAGKVTGVTTTLVYASSGAVETSVGCDSVRGLTWAGDRLLLECSGTESSPGGLVLMAPDLHGEPTPVPNGMPAPYDDYSAVESADAATGVGIEGKLCGVNCADAQQVVHRAVRFDLATGKELEVIATPAVDRTLDSVSGDAHGVLYITSGQRADAVYVRFPGEKHGTRIDDLPPHYGAIVAQP